MSDYSIKVTNKSGAPQKIAIYQQYPDVVAGLPLVWILKNVNKGNDTTFSWSVTWALNWGTSDDVLAPGVKWKSGGPLQSMNPATQGGNNEMGITYSNGEFSTNPEAFNNSNVKPGDMLVTTDTSFTVADAKLMSIAAYMNGLPALAVQGKPNGKYNFHTHPQYWICTTDSDQSVAISDDFVTNPINVTFASGVTSLSYELNDELIFVPVVPTA
ncbi:hypothetical protein GNF10_35060 [Nostoc sp. UCD121]|uniref:hypothetical protein n=1 Tax=unclassified Nostoc TaxID=2593658 RepID=UPI0016249C30|nr:MULTISPECIES: hypothetical protein [unclassified Nostoc]MBC1225419.1 hypothetical protein [Nostoc sp. UCD120]MBC1281011.1 hypothetical protein [Nostoc sp. UCD121]